jgi:S1-C subfamily serine protease
MKRATIYGWVSAAVAAVFVIGLGAAWLAQPRLRPLTQADIDAAVLHTLQTKSLPSRTARAAEAIRESVVEIRSFPAIEPPDAAKPGDAKPDAPADPNAPPGVAQPAPRDGLAANDPPDRKDPADVKDPTDKSAPAKDAPERKREARNIGSGVVVSETGVVLTNHHVVAGARRLEIRFHDGHIAEASVLKMIPEKDLAILQAKSIPDDLPAATLGNSRELAPGTEVVAVGFPFGIGPSVSAGVVSGLDREFVSPDDQQNLDSLIQFDAAANPGNSGGPLINMNGEVVGIVTAILNPNKAGTFVGIGFATTIESAGSSIGSSPF